MAVERGLEREVEALQGLDRGQAGGVQRHLDPAALAGGVFLEQQLIDRVEGGELALLEALQHLVEDLECARHAQADQGVADPHADGGHRSASPAARRRATAS